MVDQKVGLQSSSFIDDRIWCAAAMVSSSCFWPSIARSFVAEDLRFELLLGLVSSSIGESGLEFTEERATMRKGE